MDNEQTPVTTAPVEIPEIPITEPATLVAEDLQRLLEEARSKSSQYWDQLLRIRAEMDNLQRRQARELENAHKFALDGFVRELLPVADSLELGQTAAQAAATDITQVREGLLLTLKLLGDALAKFGVQSLNPVAEPFNPDYHQAMSLQSCADLEPNRVVSVVQKGYTLNGRLVRPALVIVAQKPA